MKRYDSTDPNNGIATPETDTEAEQQERALAREKIALAYGYSHVSWKHVRALARASRIDAIGAIVEAMRCYFGMQLADRTDAIVLKLSDDYDFCTAKREKTKDSPGHNNVAISFTMYEEVIFFRNVGTGLIHADIPDHARNRYVAGATEGQEHKGDGTAVHHGGQSFGNIDANAAATGKRPTSKKGGRNG
jgi:hypothetical protein